MVSILGCIDGTQIPIIAPPGILHFVNVDSDGLTAFQTYYVAVQLYKQCSSFTIIAGVWCHVCCSYKRQAPSITPSAIQKRSLIPRPGRKADTTYCRSMPAHSDIDVAVQSMQGGTVQELCFVNGAIPGYTRTSTYRAHIVERWDTTLGVTRLIHTLHAVTSNSGNCGDVDEEPGF